MLKKANQVGDFLNQTKRRQSVKKIENIVLLNKQGRQRKLNLRITLPGKVIALSAKVIFERFEAHSNGTSFNKYQLGKRTIIPDCCPMPKEDGLFICQCGRHIVYLSETKNVSLRQIAELPAKLTDCFSEESKETPQKGGIKS